MACGREGGGLFFVNGRFSFLGGSCGGGGATCSLLLFPLRSARGFVVLDGFEDAFALRAGFSLALAQLGGVPALRGRLGGFGLGSGFGFLGPLALGFFVLLLLLFGEAGGALGEDGLDLGVCGREGGAGSGSGSGRG